MPKTNCYRQRFKTAEERFLEKVDKTDGCWLWNASLKPNGYGSFSVGNRMVLAHRWAYEHFVGPIPEGLTVDHVKKRGCTSRACVNPAHLEPVTNRENLMRGGTLSAANVQKTCCINGHLLAGDNLKIDSRGMRQCRVCRRKDELRHREKDPEAYLARKREDKRRQRQRKRER